MTTRKLGDIAHARAGDKGDTSILMVAPYDPADYPEVVSAISEAAMEKHFQRHGSPTVTIHRVDSLCSLTIVLRQQLRGGVTRATTVDPHGKTISGHLLDLPI